MESATGVEQSWATDDEWTIAPEETINRRVKWPPFWWIHEGVLQYDGLFI